MNRYPSKFISTTVAFSKMTGRTSTCRFFRRHFPLIGYICLTIFLTILLKDATENLLRWSTSKDLHILFVERSEKELNFTTTPNANITKRSTKTVLFWGPMYGKHTHWQLFWFKPNISCPGYPCRFTTDRNFLNESKALLFHEFLNNFNESDFPSWRFPDQRWVLFLNEPPKIPFRDFTSVNNLFNWTMSYRTDSDVFGGYGNIQMTKVEEEINETSRNFAKGKTDLVAWFVGHCPTMGRREEYVKELQKHIPVHIYGDCGTYKCPERESYKCFKILEDKYKFYLSFENFYCRDYITEKFYEILRFNVVPITLNMGKSNHFVPSSAYIDAINFPSPQRLAEYLKMLDKNDTAYNEFFTWKRGYKVTNPRFEKVICDMCEKLHEPHPKKVYNDLNTWWNRHSECHYWENDKFILHNGNA